MSYKGHILRILDKIDDENILEAIYKFIAKLYLKIKRKPN